jgi:CubicO group peptidase (beta-lactamase class C family)/enterochelin esterase-like enzyme
MVRQSLSRLLLVGLLTLAGAVPRPAAAQLPKRQPTPNDRLVSPEVHPDKKVTFRIYAPKASAVTLRGDWMEGFDVVKLTKAKEGVWSATVGPLVPDFYSYSFFVDGVRTPDPKNPTIKQGIGSVESMFFLPGKEAAFQDNRAVPHGEIRKVWYQSATLGTQRRMHVYTPPGYEGGKERYPVLYLLHGGGDEDSGWSTVGRAGFILDNLLADKKARPMLIVMPNGSLPRPAKLPPFTPGAKPSPEFLAAMAAAQERFTNELLKEVVPYVEKHFRVRAGREHRALAGLSMGGGQTLRVVTTHPDRFAYVAVWSAGLFGGSAVDFEKRNEAFFKDAEKVNQSVKLFSISVGEKDFALAGSKSLAGLLKKHGVKHELHVSGGGHTWINWRHYLNDLAPRLFRDGPAGKSGPPGAKPLRPISRPEDVGVSSERLQRISDLVRRHIEGQRIAGAVALVARRGSVVYFETHGLEDMESKTLMGKRTRFRMASSTKPVTAVALLMLVEQGKVRLSDPVSKFIPEFKDVKVAEDREGKVKMVPPERPVTIRDLLTHTSGLVSGGLGTKTAKAETLRPRGDDTLASYAARMTKVPLDFQPGSQWRYSGLAGIDALARVVEVASGQSFDAFLRERVFEPLGMKDTFFLHDNDAGIERLASIHRGGAKRLQKIPSFLKLPKGYYCGAGGLISTAEDYFRFAQMLANGGELNGKRLLSPRSVELLSSNHVGEMFSGQLGRPKGMGFGFAVEVVTDPVRAGTFRSAGSFGWDGAFGTHFWVDPKAQLVAVFLVQAPAGRVVRGIHGDFETAVMQALTDLGVGRSRR